VTWKEIPGFSKYEVSDDGSVRRHASKIQRGPGYRAKPGALLSPIDIKGYDCFTLTNDEGRTKRHQVGFYMLLTFVGPKPSGIHEVAHWDGNSKNNTLDNLRWATPAENGEDRVRHGSMKRAWQEKTRASRLVADADPVVKKRRSDAARRFAAQPEVKIARSIRSREIATRPGQRDISSRAATLTWERPEYRENRRLTDASSETKLRRSAAAKEREARKRATQEEGIEA